MAYTACTYCNGAGTLQRDDPLLGSSRKTQCPLCSGSGARGETATPGGLSVAAGSAARWIREQVGRLVAARSGRLALMGMFASGVIIFMVQFLAAG